MMTREEILSEIRRTASENGGKPLGRAVFTGFDINARVCTGVCTPRTSPTFVTSPTRATTPFPHGCAGRNGA
jgi:hypothetical protein